MQTFDYAGQIMQALKLDTGRKCKATPEGVTFRCILPGHEDRTPSAWMIKGAWGCHRCGKQSLDTLGNHYGVQKPRWSWGITVEEYADAKGFAIDKLTRWGVHTGMAPRGGEAVFIPYYAEDGKTVIRNRIRTRKGAFWEGSGGTNHLYGMNQLAGTTDLAKPVLIVEGESDPGRHEHENAESRMCFERFVGTAALGR